MKIVFEVGHPSHVHMFRNAIAELQDRGHVVQIAAISKETTTDLLRLYGLEYTRIGANSPSIVGKALTLPLKDLAFIRKISHSKPDMIVSQGSAYSAHASAVLGVPHLAFPDTETATLVNRIMLPFTDAICTDTSFTLDFGLKHIRYRGYKELAYLHPSRFRPNSATLDRIGAAPTDKLIVVRFGRLNAHHDINHHGMRLESAHDKLAFVHALEKLGRVCVTSEVKLNPELEKWMPKVPLDEIHSLLYYASLYVGEGATMASEAGVLGTPWIYVSDSALGYLTEQESRYGLGFRLDTTGAALAQAEQLLQRPNLKNEWRAKRDEMVAEKIDVTRFMVDFIENWPASFARQARVLPRGTRVLSVSQDN